MNFFLKRILPAAIGIALLIALGWFVYDRFFKSEEDRVREVFYAIKAGAEERMASRVSEHLHEEFKYQGLTKDDIHNIIAKHLVLDYEVVKVTLQEPIAVTFDKEKKRAQVTLLISVRCKRSKEDPTWEDLTKMGGGHRYGLELVKTDKGWRILKAEITE